jgi:hypothetical protein
MSESGATLWKLTVKKKRTDGLLLAMKNLVVKWWIKERNNLI